MRRVTEAERAYHRELVAGPGAVCGCDTCVAALGRPPVFVPVTEDGRILIPSGWVPAPAQRPQRAAQRPPAPLECSCSACLGLDEDEG